jgi:hypothetical protein
MPVSGTKERTLGQGGLARRRLQSLSMTPQVCRVDGFFTPKPYNETDAEAGTRSRVPCHGATGPVSPS